MSNQTIKESFHNDIGQTRSFQSPYSAEVEVETEGFDFGGDVIVQKGWDVDRDGSLLNGLEFKTTVPKTKESLLTYWKNLYNNEKFKKYCVEAPTASIHIHANCQQRTWDEVKTIAMVYYALEPLIFDFVDKSRRGNLYALPFSVAEDGMQCLTQLFKENIYGLRGMFRSSKYLALNVSSLGRFCTLEFRHLECTFDLNKIKTWLDIIDKIMTSYRLFNDYKEVFISFNTNREALAKRVLGGDLFNELTRNTIDVFNTMDENYSILYSLSTIEDRIKNEKKSLFKGSYSFFDFSNDDIETYVPEYPKEVF